TVEEPAQRQRAAQTRVRDAQKDLRDPRIDARQAQLSLTAARREATRSLEDMNDRPGAVSCPATAPLRCRCPGAATGRPATREGTPP
ncbi:hypothetical protein CLM82_25060, partial [Streptomyces albidoflavus]|uniref:hypothetical protein n=1 Tax=Streptomyces albidoflavus TaxID=1886 RepID=UPI000BD32BDF